MYIILSEQTNAGSRTLLSMSVAYKTNATDESVSIILSYFKVSPSILKKQPIYLHRSKLY